MSTSQRMKWFGMAALAMAGLLSLQPQAIADNGGGSTGGGVGVVGKDGKLRILDLLPSDFNPVENTQRFDPKTLPAFQQIVLPMLKKLQKKVPGLATDLLQATNEDEAYWRFTDKTIPPSNDECQLVDAKRPMVQIAKQLDRNVVVQRKYFNSLPPMDQAALILHEMITNRKKRASYSFTSETPCQDKVRDAVRMILLLQDKRKPSEVAYSLMMAGLDYHEDVGTIDRLNALFSRETTRCEMRSDSLDGKVTQYWVYIVPRKPMDDLGILGRFGVNNKKTTLGWLANHVNYRTRDSEFLPPNRWTTIEREDGSLELSLNSEQSCRSVAERMSKAFDRNSDDGLGYYVRDVMSSKNAHLNNSQEKSIEKGSKSQDMEGRGAGEAR